MALPVFVRKSIESRDIAGAGFCASGLYPASASAAELDTNVTRVKSAKLNFILLKNMTVS
jgi:hypothetical protein